MKKGKGSVNRFTDENGVHYPGDIVELPASYEGVAWLERVDPVPVVAAVPGKVEPVQEEPIVPLEASSKKRRGGKMPRILRRKS